jgi:hypothetical protein
MAGFHIDEQCVRSLLGGGECGVGALPGMCFHLCPAHCSVRSPHRLPAQPMQQSNLHVCAVLPAREFARKPQRGRGAAHAVQGAVCAAALCSGNAVRCMAHRCIVASLPRCIVATLHRCIVATLLKGQPSAPTACDERVRRLEVQLWRCDLDHRRRADRPVRVEPQSRGLVHQRSAAQRSAQYAQLLLCVARCIRANPPQYNQPEPRSLRRRLAESAEGGGRQRCTHVRWIDQLPKRGPPRAL